MTHREWLERANLRFHIGGRKENTLIWIKNDLRYRPAHGDTGVRLEPKHLRGQVFPSLYKALEAEVRRVNEKLMGKEPLAVTNILEWEELVRSLCHRRQWLRLFIKHGGLSTVVAERDIAEAQTELAMGRRLLEEQAQYDAQQIQALSSAVQRGAYTFSIEHLVQDVMKVIRDDVNRQAARSQVTSTTKEMTRKDSERVNRLVDNPNT